MVGGECVCVRCVSIVLGFDICRFESGVLGNASGCVWLFLCVT